LTNLPLRVNIIIKANISSRKGGVTIKFTSNEQWQQYFALIKTQTIPRKYTRRLTGRYTKESGRWNAESQGTYQGTTNWQQYCSYINEVLKEIRSGSSEFCYFSYQISTLLEFEPERLRTRYYPRDGYWEVWLEETPRPLHTNTKKQQGG